MIYIDLSEDLIEKIVENSLSPGSVQKIISTPKDLASLDINLHVAVPRQEAAMFVATGDDPWIDIPVSLEAETVRYCVLTMAASVQSGQAEAQLFWDGEKRPGYNEHLSIPIPLRVDGRDHTYLIDLHAGDAGLLNSRWRHQGRIRRIRFDPLNKPGEFRIRRMWFLDDQCFATDLLRQKIGLPPSRQELSFRYMIGWGIELGALENPLPVPPTSFVQYADRLTLEQARKEYPELSGWGLVQPTIICDATHITVENDCVDFLIANHVLEHMRDPLGALKEWLRVVRPGGHLYIAVPEHTNSLDKHRNITPLEHMISDFDNRAERTQEDLAHFHEWVGSVNYEAAAAEQTRIAKDLIAKDYAIHFHTFSRSTFAGLLKEASRRFGGELLEYRVSVHPELVEFIAILRKGTQTRVNASISQNSATENIGRVFKRMRRRIKRVRLPHK